MTMTYRQYQKHRINDLSSHYPDATRIAVAESLGDLTRDWLDYLVTQLETGELPGARIWRQLTDSQKRYLLRSEPALRDNHLTAALLALGGSR